MTSSNSKFSASSYHPLPPDPPQQYIILLPSPRPPSLLTSLRRLLLPLSLLLLLSLTLFLLYPSDPTLSITKLKLNHLQFHTLPPSMDITLDLTLKLLNRDFYSIYYNYLNSAVFYRGKKLGVVTSDEGRVKARAESYVNALIELEGVEFFEDVVPLIADLAKGFIKFDTVTEIGGKIGFLGLFDIPLKTKVSCEIVIDIHNQTINHQNCYPE